MSKVILTIGPSSSGKTTWAREQVRKNPGKYINLNRDDVRFALFCADEWSQYKFTAAREQMVTEQIERTAERAMELNQTIIISDTNLNPATRQKWADFAKKHNAVYEQEVFHCTYQELLRRNLTRGKYAMQENVIKKQFETFMFQFGGWKKYVPDTNLPRAVIFDVDGTLMDNEGRGPFEWHRVLEDTPRERVVELFNFYKTANIKVITVSGRDSVCYDDTIRSLNDAGCFPDAHFQRKEGDPRRDDIVKEEIFFRDIAPYYYVTHTVDDRQQVIDMWRRIGLECWAVQNNQF